MPDPHWKLTGNAGTNPATNYVGTTDGQPLVIRTHAVERMRITQAGNVGMGTNSPTNQLVVASQASFGGNTSNTGAEPIEVQGAGAGVSFYDRTGGSTGRWVIYSDRTGGAGTETLRFWSSGDKVAVTQAGHVGIGATQPVNTLDVNGGVVIGAYAGVNTAPANGLLVSGAVGINTTTPDPNALLTVEGVSPDLGGPSEAAGVVGRVTNPLLDGRGSQTAGVRGINDEGHGVQGQSTSWIGVEGTSTGGYGVYAGSTNSYGLFATSNAGTAVFAQSFTGTNIIEGWDSFAKPRFRVERATGNVLADGQFTGPADFSEMLPASGSDFEPGDVLVINSDGKLAKAAKAYSDKLAGVYSTRPGFVGDIRVAEHGLKVYDELKAEMKRELWLPVALLGVVPVKVSTENGPICPGDLLTSSATPGHAMLAEPVRINGIALYPTGTILGKALAPLEAGTGVINMLVMPK